MPPSTIVESNGAERWPTGPSASAMGGLTGCRRAHAW